MIERLEPFVGSWNIEASLGPPGTAGRTAFEWALGGRFLQQRWEIEHPEFPDGLAIYSARDDGEGYVQHYFDSRGVVRVYAMTFSGGEWRLVREAPDFTPLSFKQRFVGTFSGDGDAIAARWEHDRNGSWELDFELSYTRVR